MDPLPAKGFLPKGGRLGVRGCVQACGAMIVYAWTCAGTLVKAALNIMPPVTIRTLTKAAVMLLRRLKPLYLFILGLLQLSVSTVGAKPSCQLNCMSRASFDIWQISGHI